MPTLVITTEKTNILLRYLHQQLDKKVCSAVVMAILWNKAGHYIFVLWFLLLSSFFPRVFSIVTYCMSTMLPHMMWPQCKFRMQVFNMLHAAGWKYRTQKNCENSPSVHHRTTLWGHIFATKACIDNQKPESPGRGLRSSPPACTVSLSEVQKPRDLDLDLGSGQGHINIRSICRLPAYPTMWL